MNISRVLLGVCLVPLMLSGSDAVSLNAKPISVQDRLVLNRLALNGRHTVELMLACAPTAVSALIASVKKASGAVRYIDPTVGYLRIQLPIAGLAAFIADPQIDAYQVASRSSWELDGHARARANIRRAYEVRPPVAATSPTPDPTVPLLTSMAAQQTGYTADEGMGIEKWMNAHPSYDGRGVTIAFLETAELEFSHPIFKPAKTLDGRDVAKIPDILNAIDPTEPDITRIAMTTKLNTAGTWVEVNGRTFILPRTGRYLFGQLSVSAADTLVQQFGVVRSLSSGEIWVDADGDGDFGNEQPMLGVKRQFEVGLLKITSPRKADVSFVVTAGEKMADVHIYIGRQLHNTMTASVAAGSRSADSLAYGVAPGARLLPVRVIAYERRLSDFIEGYLIAAARPDVDILADSAGTLVTSDTERDFVGLLLRRIAETYGKPIFHAAGNSGGRLSSVLAGGGAFSVGGTISPASWAAFYGLGSLPEVQVSPISAAGPALDGGLKPDFLAPMMRLAAITCHAPGVWVGMTALPKNNPTVGLPPCYRVSDGTSSSSPYAAGLAALLISAAKQERVDYSYDSLARALRASAHFLPNAQAYEQGAGVLDLEGAWREMQRGVASPRISVRARSQHPLIRYTASAAAGAGLYETDGTAGFSSVRTIHLYRDAGPSAPTEYRLSWTGNDGTFSTQRSIVLPFRSTVDLSITVAPRTTGAHSAILNLHDPITDAIVVRSLATVLAPEPLTLPSFTAQFNGRLPLMGATSHFWQVPVGTAALSLELTVKRGTVQTGLVPHHGLLLRSFEKYPSSVERTLSPGTYHFLFSDPGPGTWSLLVTNQAARFEERAELTFVEDADYTLTVRALDASLKMSASTERGTLVVSNHATELAQPVITASWGRRITHHALLNRDGTANQFNIEVPPGAAALMLGARLKSKRANGPTGLDLYLYDCTSGECFWYDVAIPSAFEQQLTVRAPQAGRWVAMVAGTPPFQASGDVAFNAVVVTEQGRKIAPLGQALAYGESKTVQIALDAATMPFQDAVQVYELFDQALERTEFQKPWVTPSDLHKMTASRPVALGVVVPEPAEVDRRLAPSAMP